MIIAGVVITTVPDRYEQVARRLRSVPGLTLSGDDGSCHLAAVWEGASDDELLVLAENLVAGDLEILGVSPTYATD